MRKFLAALLTFAVLCLPPQAGARSLLMSDPLTAGAGTPLALDGHVTTNITSTTASVALRTTASNDVIVVTVISNVSLTGIADNLNGGGGLSWTQRVANINIGGNFLNEYWAIAASPLTSGSITVTASSSTFITPVAFGVSGAKTSAPFDSGGPQTVASATNSGITMTTANANDFVFGCAVGNVGSAAGWTDVDAGSAVNFNSTGYKIVSSTGTYTYSLVGAANIQVGMIDAIVQGP